jgi:V/A-type H+-transporting ATPase subunit D
MIEDAEAGSERMTQDFAAAYHALYRVRMTLGTEKLNWIALSAPRQPEIDVEEQHIMGVRVPIVHAGGQAPALQYGLGDTAVTLDEAVRRFRDLLPVVYEMAEMLTAVWRLTREIRKTQRHVKALENVVITRVESGIRFIEDTLEEKEREEFFRAKRIKEQIEAEER